MGDRPTGSLDDLFNDAEQGICSNGTQNDTFLGLTTVTEGLNIVTHSNHNHGIITETSEIHKNKIK